MKWFACLLLVAVGSVALAKPEFWEAFRAHYNPQSGSDIAKAECGTCHLDRDFPKRNPFGVQVQSVLQPTGITPALLQQIENDDADADGASNGDEARGGTLPGDPTSGAVTNNVAPAALPAEPFVPEHSLHPLFVHFPLGIFLFGAVLDFWGRYRRQQAARSAAVFALAVGALTSLLAVVSGVLAMLRMGLPIEGTMLNHLLSGAVSTLLALGIARWRMKSEPDTPAYWVTLALASAVMALAGHLGAEMVWG